jgi:hypothetical protein
MMCKDAELFPLSRAARVGGAKNGLEVWRIVKSMDSV